MGTPDPPTPPTRPELDQTNGHRTLSVPRKLLFSIVLVTLFFAAMELLLAAVGVRPISYSEDPFVGFTSRSPLFEQVQSADGRSLYRTVSAKTSWFNPQEFSARKGKNCYRIFCLGGSTTYGRPYNDATSFCGWLREYLAALDSSRHWDVINAGGISYASYRVAALMEELIEYEPDLFIIYCGHNEFLERRTYSRLISTPRTIRDTAGMLAQSRVYTSIHALLTPSAGKGSPESAQTCELPEEVDAILDGTVGPEDYQRDRERRRQIIEHYRFNLARMIDMARSVGARVVMVTPAANKSGLSPFKSQHRADLKSEDLTRWEELVAQASDLRDAGKLEEALAALDEAITIDARYAQTQFDRGQILDELERDAEAKQAFQRAIDEDVCPLRILPARHLERAIQLEPGLASAHNSLGIAYAQSGQMKRAVAAFEQVLAISPGFDAATQNLQRARQEVK